MTRIFVDGEYGTTGLKLIRLLRETAQFELISLSERERKSAQARRLALNSCDIAVLCLPDDAAIEAVAMVENPEVKILDASVAHRTAMGWCYGFPELTSGQAERIAAARRVTNPGCFATGILSLVRPLRDAGLLMPDQSLCINAVSGYTGGGRKLIEAFEDPAAEDRIDSRFFMYGLNLQHKHLPEVTKHGNLLQAPLFIPSVGKYRQGMLVCLPLPVSMLRLSSDQGPLNTVLSVFQEHYADCDGVSVRTESDGGRLDPEALNNTNMLEIFILSDPRTRQLLLVARLDNLGKGSSGAAMRNLELMSGVAWVSG